jgi:hypothetical protein
MMKHVASVCAAVLLGVVCVRAETVDFWKTTPPYPDVVVISHATPPVASFFKSYFTAKSEHKPSATTDHFSEAHLTYIDAALGWPFYNKKGMTEIFEKYMPTWPPSGLSYPTRISGDMHSAVVAFTDTPELFGGEIRILAAIGALDRLLGRPLVRRSDVIIEIGREFVGRRAHLGRHLGENPATYTRSLSTE